MKSKAIFLLVIFLLNTLVGFACAIGLEADHEDHHEHDHGAHEHAGKTKAKSGFDLSKEEACCETLVNNQLSLSKAVPESSKLTVFSPIFWLKDPFCHTLIVLNDFILIKTVYLEQRSRPPNQNIRIAIQSFQI